MLMRLPARELRRQRNARYRDRQRRDVLMVQGEVPRRVVENLIDTEWLGAEEATDPRAIMAAMLAALRSIRK
jgi:hypothetical protein